ncbi:MAG: cytochrome c oxidase subunit 4 [Candidatus Limnocylindrales bacterium]
MLDDLWNGFLELTAQFVIPDWGAVIALLPILVLVLVVAVLLRVFLGLWHAQPARRGKYRITPATPADIHMPGPSYAPIVASIGAFMLFLGLVFGGLVLVVGVIGLVVGLLFWLREALRIYDHDVGASTPALPAIIHEGPPPGVHMPGPSFRPFLGALGVAMLMLGLVFGEWLLAVGLIALIVTLLGWLVDARKEYEKTEEADTTGHLENIAAPRTPSVLLVGLGILLAGAVVIQLGLVPPRSASGNANPAASGEPPAPAEAGASGAPGGSEAPPAGPAADVTVTARNVAFLETTIMAPADKPFTLAFINDDSGTPHNVEFKDAAGASAYKGEIFPGVATRVYDVPALAAGAYTFVCTVHPSMTGSATVQ